MDNAFVQSNNIMLDILVYVLNVIFRIVKELQIG